MEVAPGVGEEDEWVCIIVAVRNRKGAVERAIHSWVGAQGVKEVVLVDFSSSPEEAIHFEGDIVRVITVVEESRWELARAYNLGFAKASSSCTSFLKLDADNLLNKNFVAMHPLGKEHLQQYFYHGMHQNAHNENDVHLNGVFFARARDVVNVGGFDERLTLYGMDDTDLYYRLSRSLAEKTIKNGSISHLAHGDAERVHREKGEIVNPLSTKAAEIMNRVFLHYGPWSSSRMLKRFIKDREEINRVGGKMWTAGLGTKWKCTAQDVCTAFKGTKPTTFLEDIPYNVLQELRDEISRLLLYTRNRFPSHWLRVLDVKNLKLNSTAEILVESHIISRVIPLGSRFTPNYDELACPGVPLVVPLHGESVVADIQTWLRTVAIATYLKSPVIFEGRGAEISSESESVHEYLRNKVMRGRKTEGCPVHALDEAFPGVLLSPHRICLFSSSSTIQDNISFCLVTKGILPIVVRINLSDELSQIISMLRDSVPDAFFTESSTFLSAENQRFDKMEMIAARFSKIIAMITYLLLVLSVFLGIVFDLLPVSNRMEISILGFGRSKMHHKHKVRLWLQFWMKIIALWATERLVRSMAMDYYLKRVSGLQYVKLNGQSYSQLPWLAPSITHSLYEQCEICWWVALHCIVAILLAMTVMEYRKLCIGKSLEQSL